MGGWIFEDRGISEDCAACASRICLLLIEEQQAVFGSALQVEQHHRYPNVSPGGTQPYSIRLSQRIGWNARCHRNQETARPTSQLSVESDS